jgi:hypothetical protein
MVEQEMGRSEIQKQIEKLSLELEKLKRKCYGLRKTSPKLRLQKYHALLDRIAQSPEGDVTPDELIASLKEKEY